MRALSCSRDGCKMQDGESYTWSQLRYDFICQECEGVTTHRSVQDRDTLECEDWIECGRCGGQELRKAGEIRKEQVDAALVLAGLPIELQQATERARRGPQLSAAQLDEIKQRLWGG